MNTMLASEPFFRGAAALFTAPFLISVGTGGDVQALPYEATGNLAFIEVVRDAKVAEVDSFIQRLAKLQETYQLGTDQLAEIMSVSRVTVYNWRGRRVEHIRAENRARLAALEELLRSTISQAYASQLGSFLRQRLDTDSRAVSAALAGQGLISESTISLLSGAGNRLRGIQRNRQLEALLTRQQV